MIGSRTVGARTGRLGMVNQRERRVSVEDLGALLRAGKLDQASALLIGDVILYFM